MFILSKILAPFLDPFYLFSLAFTGGTILLFTRRWRLGRGLLALALGGGVLLALLAGARQLAGPLESRFAHPEPLPPRIDGIIVLGGSISPVINATTGEVRVGSAFERVLAFMTLAERYPKAKLVYSGGSGALWGDQPKEADAARHLLSSIGFDVGRVVFESRSRNTVENALFSKELVSPLPGENWVLVTSALHVPRAVGVFRKAGWPVIAYPVDYLYDHSLPLSADIRKDPVGGYWDLSGPAHEWAGLVYYYLLGRIDAILPAPGE